MTKFTTIQPLSIGILLLTTPIGGTSYAQQHQQELLESNQEKWDSFLGIPSNAGYVMTFQRSCFCMPEDLGPFHVVVNAAGDVASAIYLEPSEYAGTYVTDPEAVNVMTVQDAFDYIQRALDEGADDLDVTYDVDAGYPSVVSIDWIEMAIDDEMFFSIENMILL